MRLNLSDATKPKGQELQRMDTLLFVVTLCLMAFGIISVFDASYVKHVQLGVSPFKDVQMQALWAGIGLVVMWVMRRFPYWKLQPLANIGILISYILLLAVFVPHLGHKVNGAHRWLGSGPIRLQPSEIAKIAVMLYLASYASARTKKIKEFKTGLLRPLLIMGGIAMLVAVEPDLGTAMVIASSSLVVLFLAGTRWQHMVSVILVGVVLVTAISLTGHYRKQRLIGYLDPHAHRATSTYQVWHSMVAIGTGGVTGKGLGEGIEKMYIPEPRTDFIFAVVAEEWGLFGTIGLLTMFLLVTVRGYQIAHSTRDPFAALLAAGITSIITIQATINVAVATGAIPNTGVPLPFVSYGGSSLVFMLLGISILLNISRHRDVITVPPAESLPDSTESIPVFDSRWDRRTKLTEKDFLRTYNSAMAKGDRDISTLPQRLEQLTKTGGSRRGSDENPNTFVRDWTSNE